MSEHEGIKAGILEEYGLSGKATTVRDITDRIVERAEKGQGQCRGAR